MALRLTIELVPSTCWYSNVRSNVSARTWDRLQQIRFARAQHRCEICGGRGSTHPVELHEVWHYDDGASIQRLVDLIALCPACHEVKHIGHAIQQGRLRQALTHLIQVNHLPPNEAEAMIRSAFAAHAERSGHPWRLDLSVLSRQYGVALDADGREHRGLHG